MSWQALLPSAWAQRPGASSASTSASSSTSIAAVGRREMARALEFATAGTDAEALEFAIDQAVKAGVSSTALERAQKRKLELDEEASGVRSKRARSDVEGALEWAAGSGSTDMLQAAIAQAQTAGFSGEALQRAQEQHVEVIALSREEQAQQQALAAVRLARQNMDLWSLLSALKRCVEAEIEPELMREEALGEMAHRHGMATCILTFATQDSCLEVLDMAIEWARTEEVLPDQLAAACTKLSELQDSQERHETIAEAAAALAASWNISEPQELARVIARARRAGVGPQMVALAEKRLRNLQVRPSAGASPPPRRAGAFAPPTPGPAAALAPGAAASNAVAMAAAAWMAPAAMAPDTRASGQGVRGPLPDFEWIPEAQPAAASSPPRARAPSPAPSPEQLERQHSCKEAATALKNAMVKGDAVILNAAIEKAEIAGVSRELVAPARRKLTRLLK